VVFIAMDEKITITKDQLFKVIRLNEQETKKEEKNESSNIVDMISTLLHSRSQVHIFHWQTKSQSSFAEHMALGEYYDGIGGLLDGIVESYQGKYDILTGYDTIKTVDYKSTEQLISFFKGLDDNIEKNRKSVKESYIQNQIDTIQELIYSTLYKLRFLK
jgi:DNA-binding ferritin-like protein